MFNSVYKEFHFLLPKIVFLLQLNCCLNWWFLIKLVAGDVCCLILLLHNKNGDLNSTPTNKINVRTTVMADHIIKKAQKLKFSIYYAAEWHARIRSVISLFVLFFVLISTGSDLYVNLRIFLLIGQVMLCRIACIRSWAKVQYCNITSHSIAASSIQHIFKFLGKWSLLKPMKSKEYNFTYNTSSSCLFFIHSTKFQ